MLSFSGLDRYLEIITVPESICVKFWFKVYANQIISLEFSILLKGKKMVVSPANRYLN